MSIVGGGFIEAAVAVIWWSAADPGGTSWTVGFDNFNSSIASNSTTFGYCAPTGGAIAASVVSRSAVRARAAAMVRQRLAADRAEKRAAAG
ncbi:MAG TPA: hypothetical protein VMT10_08145 [Solirubrobacteraceae bacterium]|nr:hypothetical protein [Solirubrobacteraceae bacterium]